MGSTVIVGVNVVGFTVGEIEFVGAATVGLVVPLVIVGIGVSVGTNGACSQSNEVDQVSAPSPGISTQSPKRHSRCIDPGTIVG